MFLLLFPPILPEVSSLILYVYMCISIPPSSKNNSFIVIPQRYYYLQCSLTCELRWILYNVMMGCIETPNFHYPCPLNHCMWACICQYLLQTFYAWRATKKAREYWSGLPVPSPVDLPNRATEPGLLHCRWILYQLNYQGSSIKSCRWWHVFNIS